MLSEKFNNEDLWKGIILFGLNTATYKMGLAKSLFILARKDKSTISWDELSATFLQEYIKRLKTSPMPQQAIPTRLTIMERIVKELEAGLISYDEAVARVSDQGLVHVVPRFHTIGQDSTIVKEHFYTFDYGKNITLKDTLLQFSEQQLQELEEEFMARWSLLEGAFSINQEHFVLANTLGA